MIPETQESSAPQQPASQSSSEPPLTQPFVSNSRERESEGDDEDKDEAEEEKEAERLTQQFLKSPSISSKKEDVTKKQKPRIIPRKFTRPCKFLSPNHIFLLSSIIKTFS